MGGRHLPARHRQPRRLVRETAADLSNRGVAVYAPDRRGSGRSSGPRGHLTRYERPLDDVEQILQQVSTEHPATPVFLAASSWAAKLAVVYAARHPALLSGLLLLGPGLLPTVNLAPVLRVRVIIGHLATPTAHLPIPLTPELYTANPPYLDFIRSDPLRLLEATIRFFWETARLGRRRGRDSAKLELPPLLQGEDDKMMDVAGTRRWLESLDVEDRPTRPTRAPGTHWTSSRTAPGT